MTGGREAAYAVGNKVYGSGRPHPTSGTVDPAGYVERTANNKSSDRRSGLAAAATRRLGISDEPEAQQESPAQEQAENQNPLGQILLPDGRRVAPNATGQYTWL